MEKERGRFATWFLGGPVETRSQVPSEGITPPPLSTTSARPVVTLTTALSLSAVYSAVNILTTWISQMDLAVYRSGESITVPSLIAQPDTESSQYAFIKKTVASLALNGNAYWLVSRRQSDGTPLSIEVLNPLSMQVTLNDSGRKVFTYTGNGKGKTYTARQVTHIMTTEVPGRLTGLGPIEANRAGLESNLALREYADAWFGSSRTVRQHISTSHALDAEELAEYTRRVAAQKAANNGDLITDGDTTVSNLDLNPSEALYLEQQTFAVTDVARWFGIPPYLLLASVDGNSMTYSNLQTDTRLFVTNTLMHYMMPIQEAFSNLLPRGQQVKFKTEALLQGDTQQRYEAYAVALTAGFLQVNEVRAREGLPPLSEGDAPATDT